MTEGTPIVLAIIMTIAILGIVVFAIHIQIPDQQYCDQILENRHYGPGGPVFYRESLHKYDYSLNESKCIYDDNGKFIANPNYSIWGIRV